jgi:hypothetical protein
MKREKIMVALLVGALTFISPNITFAEVTAKSISAEEFLYQKNPDGMFFTQETLIGFSDGSTQFYGRTTTKGPDNVWIAVFDPCTEKITNYCIESVSYRKLGEQEWVKGSVTDWKPAANDPVLTSTIYTEAGETEYRDYFIHPETGLPRGGYAKVWDLPGATHGGGAKYVVSANVYYYKNINPSQITQTFGVGMAPVNFNKTSPTGGSAGPFSYGDRYDFPQNLEFQMKVRMGSFKDSVGSWFSGRILDPLLSIDGTTLTLSGNPTKILAARTGPVSCENRVLRADVMERCLNRDSSMNSTGVSVQRLSPSIENATNPTPFYPQGSFAHFEPLLKPVGYSSEWNGATWGVKGSGSCQITSGKIAMVSSNATLYSTFPPAWDQAEQTLAYRVGSLHLDHTGALHRGHFNLAVPKEFAQCLWGSNISNARASVAVTNSDGTSNVATSVLSQDSQMIYFKVAGFTFSTPQIKVKLEIPAVEPTPAASPTPIPVVTTKAAPKRTTITCVKGKTTKKVTALKPKCPAGYKKK